MLLVASLRADAKHTLAQGLFDVRSKKDMPGAIAQLGERLPCTQEVCGSIPHSSTTFSCLEKWIPCMIRSLENK